MELNLSLLAADHAGCLALLFAPEAISTDGSLHQILSESERFAAALAERLRKRKRRRERVRGRGRCPSRESGSSRMRSAVSESTVGRLLITASSLIQNGAALHRGQAP